MTGDVTFVVVVVVVGTRVYDRSTISLTSHPISPPPVTLTTTTASLFFLLLLFLLTKIILFSAVDDDVSELFCWLTCSYCSFWLLLLVGLRLCPSFIFFLVDFLFLCCCYWWWWCCGFHVLYLVLGCCWLLTWYISNLTLFWKPDSENQLEPFWKSATTNNR